MTVAIVGPTCSGKTNLALQICDILSNKVEIISADSRKIYKFMDAGTAKPSKEIREKYTFHLIDIITPAERFSAKRFELEASRIIDENRKNNKISLVVGGSWLYIRALEYGLFDEPENRAIRDGIEEELEKFGTKYLWEKLNRYDQKTAQKIHPNDTYRIVRAIEVFEKTGKSIFDFFNKEKKGRDILKIGILMEPSDAKMKITERTKKMAASGLIEETEFLISKYGENISSLNTIGYREAALFLKGLINKIELEEEIIKRTLKYYKYQKKVFSRENTIWFSKNKIRDAKNTILKRFVKNIILV